MSEPETTTADGIRAELLGLGTVEIDQNGYIVANRQRHGHVAGTRVGEFLRRAPERIEWLLRERERDAEHHRSVIAEKDRRIAELEATVAQLRRDLENATETPEFAGEMREVEDGPH